MQQVKYWLGVIGLTLLTIMYIPIGAARDKQGRWGLILISTLIAGYLNKALILSFLWSWFVEPFGVTQLTFIHANGMLLIVYLIKAQIYQGQSDIIRIVSEIKTDVETFLEKKKAHLTIVEIAKAKLIQELITPWFMFALPGFLLQFLM